MNHQYRPVVRRALAFTDALVLALVALAIGCGSPASASAPDPLPAIAADCGTKPGLVLFLGNSLTRGSGASTPSESYPAQTMRLLGSSDAWENLGRDSITTAQMLLDAPLLVDVQADGTRPITAVVWEIGNDLWYGATRDEAEKRYADYLRGRRALGIRIIAATVPKRANPTMPPTWDADRQAVNDWVRTNWRGFADGLAELDIFPVVNSDKYAKDGIHYNDAGYADEAAVVAEQLRAVLP